MVSPHLASNTLLLQNLDSSERLFKHRKRPKWGIGLWVKEEKTRRTIVWQDGRVRTFKEGYYGLLEPVDPDEVDAEDLYEQLAGEHELALKDKARQAAKEERPPVMTFAEQVEVFKHLYPEGFSGETWLEKRRTPAPGRKPRKSHLSAASALARRELSRERLEALLEAGDHAAIHQAMIHTLRRTSLVDLKRDVRPLEELDEHDMKKVTTALVDLLWGDDRYRFRFKRWLAALRGIGFPATWSMATVMPALVFPEEHIWVKRRAIELQARSLRPGMSLRSSPNRRGYRKARGLTKKVRKKMAKKGLEHNDLLDVTGFIWDTLRPRGQKVLKELQGE